MQTAVPNSYASGDVVAKRVPKLTPTAEFESNYIAAQILGLSDAPICYPAIPNLVFTLPRIAQVGVTVDEAEAAMMLDFLTLIINKKMTALELRQMIFAFPTQTYSVVSGLIPLLKQM